MGNAAQCSLESFLGPYQKALQPAAERLEKAEWLGKRIEDFLEGSQDACGVSVAWWLLCKCMKESLSYDTRIIPSTNLADILQRHQHALRRVAGKIVGRELVDLEWRRLQLPGPLGGMSLRTALSSADASFLATWISTNSTVKTLCGALGRPTATDVAKLDAFHARDRLKTNGVVVDMHTGAVAFTEEANSAYLSSPWCQDMQISELLAFVPSKFDAKNGLSSKTHSRVMRGLEALEACRVHQDLPDAFQCEVLLSSGGRHSGKLWSQPPRFAAECLDNDHFRMAMQLRLGMVRAPEGAVCQIPRAKGDGEQCLTKLTNPLEHPHLCKCGPARLRPHRSLLVTLLRLLRKEGCFADEERAVPCLYRIDENGRVTEAILDVILSLPGGLASSYLDVTVRCPHSVRNSAGARAASSRASVAAADGELEKLTRYGSSVQAVSFETYGRLGRKSEESLRAIAHMAASQVSRASRRSGTDLYSSWRLALERTLAKEIADITLLCLGHSSGLMALMSRRRRQIEE